MQVIHASDVNWAFHDGLQLLQEQGVKRDSRNGAVILHPEPVTTVYHRPMNRVLFSPLRDANPFFHLFESLWMLAGRSDLAYVVNFAKNMRSYSDDGVNMWGAYGWRWRSFFGHDQLAWAIDRLQKNPDDRRVVVQMWDGTEDLIVADQGGKDVPCNLAVHFQVSPVGHLNMTVFCRSNDIIWGAYGANAVHMSILQEYVASAIGIPVGTYWQVSDNYHAYEELFNKMLQVLNVDDDDEDLSRISYTANRVSVHPLFAVPGKDHVAKWNEDLLMFLEEPGAVGFRNSFFRKIAKPMLMAHEAFKQLDGEDRFLTANEILMQMPERNDWRTVAMQWMARRWQKWRNRDVKTYDS